MNQILLTEDLKSKNNNKPDKINSYSAPINNPIKSKQSQPIDIKKIIVFFGVVILIFGIAIAGIYGYRMYKNKKGDNQVIDDSAPNVSIDGVDGTTIVDDQLILRIKSNVGISKIVYIWNDDDPIEAEKNGIKDFVESIPIPETTEKLEIQVFDVNGKSTSNTYTIQPKEDEGNIEIEISIIGAQLKITATGEEPIKYITYNWKDQEEIMEVAQTEDKTMEVLIDVERGENEITITAVDESEHKKTIVKPVKVVNNPEIKVTRSGDRMYMKVTHDMGIKSIEFNVNNKVYNYDENYAEYDASKTEVEFSFELKEGANTVIITAVSGEDTTEVYKGKCTYTPEN